MGNYNFDEDEVDEEAIELFETYVKNELEAAESINRLSQTRDVSEINKAATIVYDRVLDEVESEQRKRTLYVILAKVGEAVGSQSMVQTAEENLKEMLENR